MLSTSVSSPSRLHSSSSSNNSNSSNISDEKHSLQEDKKVKEKQPQSKEIIFNKLLSMSSASVSSPSRLHISSSSSNISDEKNSLQEDKK
eukprot:7891076-Ditylum_brightwellii.AAC.1